MSGDLPEELFRPRTPTAGASMPVVTSAKAASALPGRRGVPEAPPSRRPSRLASGPSGQLGLLAVSLAALVGLAGGQMIHRALAETPTATSVSTPTAGVEDNPGPVPWQGAGVPLPITRIEASCVAPDGYDASGETISFAPAQVTDDRPETAWRCNGNGVGQRLLFTVAPRSVLVGVAVVNGWTRAEGKGSLYDQYRRVTSVRWDLPDGSWFVQNLSDNDRAAQTLMIPPTSISGTIRMTILSSSKPGRPDQQNRDAVLLSEVSLLTRE